MSNSPRAIEDFKGICFKCLKKKITAIYSLYRSNYGSSFDNNYTYMQICDECKPKDIKKWFDEEPELIDGWCEDYKYEDCIIEFVDTFSVEGQELFWNRCAYGACSHTMESQDWIEKKLGTLPDEIYEQYGMYSPKTIRLYRERFPTCNHPINIIYSDKSKGCWCVFDASGEYDQKAEEYNISGECASCQHFVERNEPLKNMTSKEFELYKKYFIGKMKYLELRDKFE